MNGILICILLYVSVQLVIGYVVSRRIRTEQDYLIAGRRLAAPLVVFSVFATWFGAETCIGSAGEAYRGGLAAVTTDPFGYTAGLLLMGALLAVPLWKRKLTTLADLFRQRYGQNVERLAALIMVPTSLLWAAAQMRAFGQVLAASSELEVTLAVSLAAAVIITYTTLGGMLADAISDFVQGIILITGLTILAVIVAGAGGTEAFARLSGETLSLIPTDTSWLATAEARAVPIFGTLVAQELVARVISARSPAVARNATITAAMLYLMIGLIPVGVGLTAPVLMPEIAESEQVLMQVAQHHLPSVLYVIFVGALVAAILTTADGAQPGHATMAGAG